MASLSTAATVETQEDLLRFDLGGVGRRPGGRLSVNLAANCDIRHDFTDLDGFVMEDGIVDEFFLSHALEHVPIDRYWDFLGDLRRKLKPGGRVVVVQTDAAQVIKQWLTGQLTFRAMRATIFTPEDRIGTNPLNRHQNMWSADELARDFQHLGFTVSTFGAGSWPYDFTSERFPEDFESCQGVPIQNLGVIATK